MFGNVGGAIVSSKAALYTTDDALLTAAAVDRVDQRTVFHLGTQDGRIKKVRVIWCLLFIDE